MFNSFLLLKLFLYGNNFMGMGLVFLILLVVKWWVGMVLCWWRFLVLWGEVLLLILLVFLKIEFGLVVLRGCFLSGI